MKIEHFTFEKVGILLTFDEKDIDQLKSSLFLNYYGLLGHNDIFEAIHERTFYTSTVQKLLLFIALTSCTSSQEEKQKVFFRCYLEQDAYPFGAKNEGMTEQEYWEFQKKKK